MFLLFLFSFNVVLGLLLLLFWFVLSSILCVNVCVSVSCPLIFFLCYRIKNNSLILCQLFWSTSFLWQQLLEMFLKVYNFFFYLRISQKNPWKMWYNRSSLLGKLQITIWNFPDSELQETHFHTFYLHTSLLLWQIILNYIILIFFIDCAIVLYLRFYILGWSASKIYGRYKWIGLTTSQI